MSPDTLINDNALTVLRQMDDESIDFIITDPPYGIDYFSKRDLRKQATPSAATF